LEHLPDIRFVIWECGQIVGGIDIPEERSVCRSAAISAPDTFQLTRSGFPSIAGTLTPAVLPMASERESKLLACDARRQPIIVQPGCCACSAAVTNARETIFFIFGLSAPIGRRRSMPRG
jgi:hypothetical protein